jgi:hypothetical protein
MLKIDPERNEALNHLIRKTPGILPPISCGLLEEFAGTGNLLPGPGHAPNVHRFIIEYFKQLMHLPKPYDHPDR